MMLARKWDRLEEMVQRQRYDIFDAVSERTGIEQGADGTVIAEIRDLRRYLLLVEAEVTERGALGPVGPDIVVQGLAPRSPAPRRFGLRADDGPMGTPEDGGHHARQIYLDDGLDEPPGGCGAFYMRMNGKYIVDRTKLPESEWDQLPRLPLELNNKEHADQPLYYQALYSWSGEKWHLRQEFYPYWGKQP